MKRAIVLLSMIGLALAGCTGTASAPTTTANTVLPQAHPTTTSIAATTTTESLAALGYQVVSILMTNNTIQADKKSPGTTGFPGISAAFSQAAQQLQALTYPANAQADAKTLVAILAVDATQMTGPGVVSVAQNLENDEGTEVADSDALRHDIGLPPASP